MADFDVSQISKLAADLGKGNAEIVVTARKILTVASVKIKKDMAAEIGKSPHFKGVAPAVSYDIKALSSEIGPVQGKAAGSLAFIAAYGTGTQGPTWDHTAALHREAPIFATLLLEAANKTIL